VEPQTVVRRGYDDMGDRYLEKCALHPSSPRHRFLARLLTLLKPGSSVLELGCGPGYPVTQTLGEKHRVVAVELSGTQLKLARRHAAAATLLQADMTRLHFRPVSFDAVVAFYSLTHVPRHLHAVLLGRVREWLVPGGLFLATMGAGDAPGSVEEDWLGVPMFFSHFDESTNLDLVRNVGLRVEDNVVVPETEHDGREVTFLWVLARNPTTSHTQDPLT
jgi:cyclopropane fatty-acyl-phospholipid synthase-like methyltransferase